jgi:hypothetical protein
MYSTSRTHQVLRGGVMSLRSKLTIGLGFLFIIIFGLAFYSSYQIQKLSKDANNILKDNYDSLVYCKNMLLALDDMNASISNNIFGSNINRSADYYQHLFESSRRSFDSNLDAEKNNITEIHESEYVGELGDNYKLYLGLCLRISEKGGSSSQYFNDFLPIYSNVRQAIININDLNMQAVERKSLLTRHNASSMTISIAAVGTLCILLAFFYFWYFPFYVSNTISYLAKKMEELLQNTGIKFQAKTKDEAFVLLQSINLLENKFAKEKKSKKEG